MKTKFTLVALLIAAFFSGFAQQVPNGSFENWTSSVTPDSWTSPEAANGLPSSFFTFKDTIHTDGSYSVKMVCDSISLAPQAGVIGTFISLGTATAGNGGTLDFHGVPFTYRPDSVIFDYMYTSPGADTGFFQIELSKNFTDVILAGGVHLRPTGGVWAHASIPLAGAYNDANTPDTLLLQFFASATQSDPIKGTTLHVDGLRFGYVNQPAPTINASITAGGPVTFCTGDSVTLQANTGTNYTYQWDLNASAISGATASSYVAKASGAYTVIIDSAGINATSNTITVTDTACGTIGIKNVYAAQLSVYPNPASTQLHINSTDNLDGFNLQMFDIVGRMVLAQTLEGNSNVINVVKLSNGTYIFRITDKENALVSQNKFNVIK